MARLLLLRHGESQWNLENRFTGWVDVPLSPRGMQEAKDAGEKLRPFTFDRAFTSVLARANETLRLVLELLANRHPDRALREHRRSSGSIPYSKLARYLFPRPLSGRALCKQEGHLAASSLSSEAAEKTSPIRTSFRNHHDDKLIVYSASLSMLCHICDFHFPGLLEIAFAIISMHWRHNQALSLNPISRKVSASICNKSRVGRSITSARLLPRLTSGLNIRRPPPCAITAQIGFRNSISYQ